MQRYEIVKAFAGVKMKRLLLAPLLLIGITACSTDHLPNWKTYNTEYYKDPATRCPRRGFDQIDLNSFELTEGGIIHETRAVAQEQNPCNIRTNSKLYENEKPNWVTVSSRSPSATRGLTNCVEETHWFESERVGPFSTTDWRKIKGKWWSFQEGKKIWRLDKGSSGFDLKAEKLLQEVCVINNQSLNKKES